VVQPIADRARVLVGRVRRPADPAGRSDRSATWCAAPRVRWRAPGGGGSRDDVLAAMQDEFSNPLRPTVVVIEDLHWADEATLDAVRFLGRRIGGEPTVLIATYRDDLPADHPLHLAMGELTGDEIRRISSDGLSVAAIAELARSVDAPRRTCTPSPAATPSSSRRSWRPPRRAGAGDGPRRDLGPVATPGRPPRSALEQLAVAPGGLELHIAGQVIPGGVEALADAERRGLVVVGDGRIRYAHEITRRAVVAECPAAQLAGAHAQLLAVLDPSHSDPSRLLHHAIGAGDAVRVARHAPAAAEAAAQAGAHRDAAAALAQALRYPELLDPPSS
jgi:hypothetical protein